MFLEVQVYQVLVSKDVLDHQDLQGCQDPRGTGGSAFQVSRVSQALREKMALWGPEETLDSQDQMELQVLKDKMDHRDSKVVVV